MGWSLTTHHIMPKNRLYLLAVDNPLEIMYSNIPMGSYYYVILHSDDFRKENSVFFGPLKLQHVFFWVRKSLRYFLMGYALAKDAHGRPPDLPKMHKSFLKTKLHPRKSILHQKRKTNL